jgi:hypothetical protein
MLHASAAEAVVAVDRLAARRAERDRPGLAAVRAHRLEHLTRRALAISAANTAAAGIAATRVPAPATSGAVARTHCRIATSGTGAGTTNRLARAPTTRTTPRITETAIRVELLLACREHELLAAVGTGQRSISGQRNRLLLLAGFATLSREGRERESWVRRYWSPRWAGRAILQHHCRAEQAVLCASATLEPPG